MQHWNLCASGDRDDRAIPEILTSTDEGRAILVRLNAGQRLAEHQVHERAWVSVVEGSVDVRTPRGGAMEAESPALFSFDPGERHSVQASTDASLLLLLTPWPGPGHPGATPLALKSDAHVTAMHRQGAVPT